VKARLLLILILVASICASAQPVKRPGATHPVHRGFWGGLPWYFPDSSYAYAPEPAPVVAQQPTVYVLVPQTPVEPAKAEIHEYKQPAASTPADEQTFFAIVLRDGSMHSAVAVTVQKSGLYYVDPEGGHRLVSLDALDREATLRANRERNLRLQLPPSA
jgi:hypothetical protein